MEVKKMKTGMTRNGAGFIVAAGPELCPSCHKNEAVIRGIGNRRHYSLCDDCQSRADANHQIALKQVAANIDQQVQDGFARDCDPD